MRMQKGVILINKVCVEGCTRHQCANRLLLHRRIISIRIHRTALRHPIVSTSNTESVEVGEDASEMSCLREPV